MCYPNAISNKAIEADGDVHLESFKAHLYDTIQPTRSIRQTRDLVFGEGINFKQLDSLIDSCLALKELDLKLHEVSPLRQLGFETREESEEEENAIDYTKLKPHLTVRTAKLKLYSILPKYVGYILHRFPKLTSLDLVPLASHYELTPTCNPITVSNDAMLNFLLALRKMRHVHHLIEFKRTMRWMRLQSFLLSLILMEHQKRLVNWLSIPSIDWTIPSFLTAASL